MLGSYGRHGADAYDLVERLPPGPARAAAWNAYVCQTYADKLAQTCTHSPEESGPVARALYDEARLWLDRSENGAPGGSLALELPPWGSPFRSYEQLVAMRETLHALRTFVAFAAGESDPRLASIDRHIATADSLWIARPSPELSGGIGGALIAGIKEASALGSTLAQG